MLVHLQTYASLSSDLAERHRSRHPVFVLNLICPHSEYDMLFAPDKSLVEFRHWEAVSTFVEKCITAVLKHLTHRTVLPSSNVAAAAAAAAPHADPMSPALGPPQTPLRLSAAPASETPQTPFATTPSRKSLGVSSSPAGTARRRTLPITPGRSHPIPGDSIRSPTAFKRPREEPTELPDDGDSEKESSAEAPPARRSLAEIFSAWENPFPSIGQRPEKILRLCDDHGGFSVPVSMAKSSIGKMQVIGQLDRKFILTRLGEQIFVFDQHAVHERIRVEKLNLEAFALQAESELRVRNVTVLEKPCVLSVSTAQSAMLVRFVDPLGKWGFEFRVEDEQLLPMAVRTSSRISVYQIPSLLLHSPAPTLEDAVRECLIGHSALLAATTPSSFTVPVELANIVNQKACKGAIKFGDELSYADCQQLLVQLSRCDFPFECAHGRPSVCPLAAKLPPSLHQFSGKLFR
eukprot:TRINITY_DN7639_c0_g1_i2.p1 TRINITY_DN7639_c0_g1~~TRINITY_DN7639_c0_g1_i2.p1  ORF type:complete len:462 (+),score=60.61 TRINITY_DN7639_c0_g1_i2:544-1929(+)